MDWIPRVSRISKMHVVFDGCWCPVSWFSVPERLACSMTSGAKGYKLLHRRHVCMYVSPLCSLLVLHTYHILCMYVCIYIFTHIILRQVYMNANHVEVLLFVASYPPSSAVPNRSGSVPRPWDDPKHGSTLRPYNLHHRSIRVKTIGCCFFDPGLLDQGPGIVPRRVGVLHTLRGCSD